MAISLALIIGALIPVWFLLASTAHMLSVLLLGPLVIGALVAITYRWPSTPLVVYWVLYSFVSVFQLATWRVAVAGVPIAVPDAVMAWIAIVVCVRFLGKGRLADKSSPSSLPLGMVGLLGYGILSAGLGLIHGFSLYAISIDLRALSYLAIGFAAARLTMPAYEHERAIAGLFILGLAGLVLQQSVITLQEFARIPGLSVSIAALRDIGVPFYLGKYGIFLLLLLPLTSTRTGLAVVGAELAGLAAMVATFVRTAWLETVVGIGVLTLLGGWRTARRSLMVTLCGLILVGVGFGVIPQIGVVEQAVQGRLNEFSQPVSYASDTVAIRLEESRLALANLRTPEDWVSGVGLGLSVSDGLHPNQHNSFVWALSKQGIVGLVLFTFVIVVIPLLLCLRALPSCFGLRRALVITLLAAHVANAVGGYASGNLTFSAYTPLLGMSLAWIADFAPRSSRAPRAQ